MQTRFIVLVDHLQKAKKEYSAHKDLFRRTASDKVLPQKNMN